MFHPEIKASFMTKTGDPSRFPYGHGPQGDVIRIYNFVRPVRSIQK